MDRWDIALLLQSSFCNYKLATQPLSTPVVEDFSPPSDTVAVPCEENDPRSRTALERPL